MQQYKKYRYMQMVQAKSYKLIRGITPGAGDTQHANEMSYVTTFKIK